MHEFRIPDPTDSKPDDWDEDAPMMIADPNAVKPDGWLDDEVAVSSTTVTAPTNDLLAKSI